MQQTRRRAVALIAILIFASLHQSAKADEPKAPPPGPPPEAAQDFAKLQQPGPQHAMLKMLVGDWEGEYEWVVTPGGEPKHSKGTIHNEAVLGGRFIEGHFDEDRAGKRTNGQNLIGYDNARKRYVATWVNEETTELITADGIADATGQVITFGRDVKDEATGIADHIDFVITIVDQNHHYFDVLLTPSNTPPFRVLRITYTRKK